MTNETQAPEETQVSLLREVRDELVAIREAFEQIATAVGGLGAMFGGQGNGGGFLGG